MILSLCDIPIQIFNQEVNDSCTNKPNNTLVQLVLCGLMKMLLMVGFSTFVSNNTARKWVQHIESVYKVKKSRIDNK